MNSKSNGAQQPSWRYWGEESIDGAVFTVYLKKVRYFNASKVIHSDSEDEIAHLEWETVRVRMMKAGTLERFVECMSTENGELDSTYVNVFLATYRTFTTTEQVLDQLLDRYRQIGTLNGVRENSQDLLRKTIRLVLTVWLDTYPDDFRVPPNYSTLNKLLEFAVENLPDNELELRIRHKFEKFHKEDGLKDLGSLNSTANKVFKNLPVNGESGTIPSYNFVDYPTDQFAQQLTCIDANLFKQLRPHHCLGAVWARRERTRNSEASSVVATIEQFNAVSFRVISTVLSDSELKPGQRAKIISKWVDIAQMLRMLKNFSSLKAIVCGLQSNPIYRLKKTWLSMAREKVELFEEMARIFSEDNNQMACRELLMKEGTAKVAEMVGENDRHLMKCIQKQQCNGQSTIQGTVPYLGTFLTDLTMIDTAIPDTCSDGLINFDKKRKEFEVIAQIKLLQSAANSYQITPDANFQIWFNSLPILDDKESYDMSCHIEPNGSGSVSKDKRACHKLGFGHKKSDSIASTSSSSSSQFYDQVSDTISIPSSPNDSSSLERKMSTSSSSSSLPSLDASLSSATSASVAQVVPPSPYQTPDFYIIRVSVHNNGQTETEGVILYKSIMLANNERTPTVIRNAMMKHNIEGDPDDYCLAQILPDGEMVFPNNANVYYAMSTAHDLNFILRLRKHDDTPGVRKTKQPKAKKRISMSV